jgi:hypothetical protein
MRTRSPGRPPSMPRPSRHGGTRGPTGGVVNHAFHDHAKHFIPWVAWLMSWAAGTGLHFFASTSWSMVGVVTLLVLGTIGLTWSTWETCLSYSAVARWHGVITVNLVGAWLVMCTINGFITVDTSDPYGWVWSAHGPTIGYWLLGGFLAASWNERIRAWEKAEAIAEAMAAMNPEPTPMEQAGLPGARWALKRINQWRSEGVLSLAPGQTYDNVVKKLEDLASAHDLPPHSVTAHQPKGIRSARKVHTTVMHDDPLQNSQPWPGLTVKVKDRK